MGKTKIFIAYAREDEEYLNTLIVFLKPLQKPNGIKVWYDGEVTPGSNRKQAIKDNFQNADIILLLVSAESLNYFDEKEIMKDALELHDAKKTLVIPIMLRQCLLEDTPLCNFKALPSNDKFVNEWTDKSAAYKNIADGIKDVMKLVKKHEDSPTLTHLYTIEQIKQLDEDNKILFENQLTFFTDIEIENHELLIKYLKHQRAALLLGYPATGKTIAVVDIAERLEQDGYTTYYHSFKKKDRWAEVWEEIIKYANTDTVFVLDDIHLNLEAAGEALLKLNDTDSLNILFLSRVIKEKHFPETTNVYKELKDYTCRTEQPSIDEKVEGIARRFQVYYQKNGDNYPIGSFVKITKKVHRNLVVLSEYLKFWKELPSLPMEQIEEKELYEKIYKRYFDRQDIQKDWHTPLLQYLCLYYFEINFYANPEYYKETEALAKNANRIIDESAGLYSIYHGEYAFLLLKAYRAVNRKKFKIKYNDSWHNFFFEQIRGYLMSFVRNGDFPNNLLELLIAIPRFKKKIQGGINNNKQIFRNLVEDDNLKIWIQDFCRGEENGRNIALFLFLIIDNSINSLKFYYEPLNVNGQIFENYNAIGIYMSAYTALKEQSLNDALVWLKEYHKNSLTDVIKFSNIDRVSNNLRQLADINEREAVYIYNLMDNEFIIEKLKNYSISEVCKILTELKKVNREKTVQLYLQLSDEDIQHLLIQMRPKNVNKILKQLKNIDERKTDRLYQKLFDERLLIIIEKGQFKRIYQDLNQLKNIDEEKTKKAYIQLDTEKLLGFLLQGRIQDVSKILKYLGKLSFRKTKDIYEQLPNEKLRELLLQTDIGNISHALAQLHDIDEKKTRLLYMQLPNQRIQELLSQVEVQDTGITLRTLHDIDAEKTRLIYLQLVDNDLYKSILEAKVYNIVSTLYQLKTIDETKVKQLYLTLSNEKLAELLSQEGAYSIANAIYQLYTIDKVKTKEIYLKLSNKKIVELLLQESLYRLSNALCQLKTVDKAKTKAIYINLPDERLIELLLKAKINNLAETLYQLKDIDREKTKILYMQISLKNLKKLLSQKLISQIGITLNKLKNVDKEKTERLYLQLPKEKLLEELLEEGQIALIGSTLNYLKEIDKEKTQELEAQLSDENSFEKALLQMPIDQIGNALNQLKKISPNAAKRIYHQIPSENLFTDLAEKDSVTQISNILGQLRSVSGGKTRCLYLKLSNDELVEMLKGERLNVIVNCFNQLKKVDKEKTAVIYKNIGNRLILSKVGEVTADRYRNFIFNISVFPKLIPELAKEMYLQLPENILFNWERLEESTSSFNMLTHCLQEAGFTEEDKWLKKLLNFGWDNREYYLDNPRIQSISSYIDAVSDFSSFQTQEIKNRLDSFKEVMITEKDRRYVPRFIATIHRYYPEQAVDILFKTFRDVYPDEKEVISYTDFYIAKNYLEKGKTNKALPHLQAVAPIFKAIEHQESYEEVQRLLRENY